MRRTKFRRSLSVCDAILDYVLLQSALHLSELGAGVGAGGGGGGGGGDWGDMKPQIHPGIAE